LVVGNIANNGIQWEVSQKANLGIDLIILNDRISVSCDVYKNKTKELLGLKKLPEKAGIEYYWGNGGELTNNGFDVSANVKVLNVRFLKWEFGTSVGHYKNEIVSLPDGDYSTYIYNGEILTAVGKPAGVFYGYKTKGVFASAAEAKQANLKMVGENGLINFEAGDIYFDDKYADGIINEKDKQVIGDPNPDFYGSFRNKFVVKSFTLDILFTFSYGNDIYNYSRSQLESGTSIVNQLGFSSNYQSNTILVANQTKNMLTRWTYDGQQTSQPRADYNDLAGNSRFSDRWIEDGSYLRLKSLTLNYKVPIHSDYIDGLSIWASANNLWTVTNYLGTDPELSVSNNVLYQGIDVGLLPNCKSYFIGIKLNL
jgi:hypothetical protein